MESEPENVEQNPIIDMFKYCISMEIPFQIEDYWNAWDSILQLILLRRTGQLCTENGRQAKKPHLFS